MKGVLFFIVSHDANDSALRFAAVVFCNLQQPLNSGWVLLASLQMLGCWLRLKIVME